MAVDLDLLRSWPVASCPADRDTLARITGDRRLADPAARVIAAGQQPAYGLGPAYVLNKAAHACALASQVGGVPLYWCASEDHDAGEAAHADLVSDDGRIHRFHRPLPRPGASLAFQAAVEHWPAFVEHCQGVLGHGLGRDWVLSHGPEADESLGVWSARLIRSLFAEHGLVVVEAAALRPLFTTGIRTALDHWPGEALARLRHRLLAEGAADAFGPLDAPPLFDDAETGRKALDAAEARALLAKAPLRCSPGAALRPVLQQLALPVAAYCAGPGEMAYHRFIGPVYEALGARPPLLVRRFGASLLSTRDSRQLSELGLSLADLDTAQDKPVVSDVALDRVDQLVAELQEIVDDSDRGRRIGGSLRRIANERQRLSASLARGQRQAAQRPSVGTLRQRLRPRGGPQERSVCSLQMIWRHGPGIIDTLVQTAAGHDPAAVIHLDSPN